MRYSIFLIINIVAELSMKSYRTPTTLCTDNVTFDDHHCHLITISRESNLQTLLASGTVKERSSKFMTVCVRLHFFLPINCLLLIGCIFLIQNYLN